MENKRTNSKEIIAYLAEKYPACFSIKGAAKPLKVGIFQELAQKLTEEDSVSKTRLRQALRHYTSSWRYLKAVKMGSFRVDLDGNDVVEVDQAQADHASNALKESQEKFASKKPKESAAKKSASSASSVDKKALDESKKAKFNKVKSVKRAEKKVITKLKPVETSSVAVGSQVKVQVGKTPMDATITEVSGNDISVQLRSGMVVKTQIQNIFTE